MLSKGGSFWGPAFFVRTAASPRSCKTRRISFACSRAALASVGYLPVGDDGRKQLLEFASNIDLVDGLPFVGEHPVDTIINVPKVHTLWAKVPRPAG